jgi:serine/threonine protein kinase
MPAAIPDRFQLEMRLGRDGDIEEWLAMDTSLDRPVLVRSLGPETTPERRAQFVTKVGDAAKVAHPHLARVFAVAEVDGGAYSVSEWTGGSTVADRVGAAHPIELPDFLPNASGLAGALSALHELGAFHGAIDLSAISYSAAHAAKLGAFGRVPHTDADGDVRGLAAALESALTGASPGGPPPSERIDGLSRTIDRILRSGQSGDLSASEMEKALLAAPTPRLPAPEPRATSRRLIISAIVLVLVAVGLVGLGRVITGGGEPILPAPVTTTLASATTVVSVAPTTISAGAVDIGNTATFDPFGEGGENDDSVANLVDGNTSTIWQTERYQDPLALIKPGVGVTLTVTGTPARVQLVGISANTSFELYWSDIFYAQLDQWARIAGAQAQPGETIIDLPTRVDGFWLVWLTDLPQHVDGSYFASISEVRFLP